MRKLSAGTHRHPGARESLHGARKLSFDRHSACNGRDTGQGIARILAAGSLRGPCASRRRAAGIGIVALGTSTRVQARRWFDFRDSGWVRSLSQFEIVVHEAWIQTHFENSDNRLFTRTLARGGAFRQRTKVASKVKDMVGFSSPLPLCSRQLDSCRSVPHLVRTLEQPCLFTAVAIPGSHTF